MLPSIRIKGMEQQELFYAMDQGCLWGAGRSGTPMD
jgi:hypothetical protein